MAMHFHDNPIYMDQIRAIARELPHRENTICITGATGMIGSCLTDILLCADEEYGNRFSVIALGRNESKLRERFAYAAGSPFLKFAVRNIMAPLELDNEPDFILHLASNADPRNYALYPAETLLANVCGTHNMLDYCRAHKKTRLLMTSTFEVYGKNGDREVFSEDDSGEVDLNQIRSCYPESKRAAEIMMRCYHQEYGVDCVIARLSSIYGPTMASDDSKAHAQFIRNGLRKENIVLKSEGLQRRTYTYLMDTTSAILTIMFRGESGQAYNVSNENSVASIAEVAGTVAHICGTKVVYDLPDDVESRGFSRPQNCILDNGKLRALGWSGRYTLTEGLKATIKILS